MLPLFLYDYAMIVLFGRGVRYVLCLGFLMLSTTVMSTVGNSRNKIRKEQNLTPTYEIPPAKPGAEG
jgi:hypothetical protein